MMHTTEARIWFTPPAEADRYLPEGPRAWGDGVVWINIQSGTNATTGDLWLRTTDHDEPVCHPLPSRVGFVITTASPEPSLQPRTSANPDVFIVGCEKVVGEFRPRTAEFLPLAAIPDTHPRTIINDAEATPDGRAIVFGTKDVNFAGPLAHLYLFTLEDRIITTLRHGQTCSNGKVFFNDDSSGLILLDIDTPKKVVTRNRLDMQSRTLHEIDVAIDLRDRPDYPDGMIDGGHGTVIIAFYNPEYAAAGEAVRYDLRTGKAVERWLTPGSPRVTCPLLVNRPGGRKLILTTAVEGMEPELRARCPNAGCIFIADVS